MIARLLGDRTEYKTRTAIAQIEDLLVGYDDTIRLFHLTIGEFLLQKNTPFFVSSVEGAIRLADLTLDADQRRTFGPTLLAFCTRHLISWLLQCSDMRAFATRLVSFYDESLSQREGPAAYSLSMVKIGPLEEKLVAHLAAVGQAQTVLDIIALAFAHAERRFNESGAEKWVHEGYLPPPKNAEKRAVTYEINWCFGAIDLALGWVRALAKADASYKLALQKTLSEQQRLLWLLGWLDWGCGARTLQISGYFEDQAWSLRSDWDEIAKTLS